MSFSSKKDADEYIGVPTVRTSGYIIYTDGACSNNGTSNTVAGIGIYFPDGDRKNISEKFNRDRPSNQRAEVLDVIRALEEVPYGDIEIRTDSRYTIDSMTNWIFSWLKNGWKKNTVVNRDLLEELYTMISNRDGKVSFHSCRWSFQQLW